MTTFTTYKDFEKFVLEQTGCKMFSSQGINYRKDKKTCILRSVDGTSYYDDNLEDMENPQYTLYGPIGDQNENAQNNKNLLDPVRTEKIFLFRRTPKLWIWYGRYVINSKVQKIHPDKNNMMRRIIVLQLEKYQ